METYFQNLDPKVIAAIVAAITSLITLFVSSLLQPYLERKGHRDKVQIDHEYEQKRKIKESLATYKVHIVNSADSLKSRIANLFEQYNNGWQNVNGNYADFSNYYFHSTVYRLLNFLAWRAILMDNLIYLDTTIASKEDLKFIKYLKLIESTLQRFKLVDDLDGNMTFEEKEKDVIFRNDLEALSLVLRTSDSSVYSFEEYKNSAIVDVERYEIMCRFVDGISPIEKRLRWDRLVAMYIYLVAFLNEFGYDYQKVDPDKMRSKLLRQNKYNVINKLDIHTKKYKMDTEKSLTKIIKKAQTVVK